MKELPKNRLTFKEGMLEGQYLSGKTKEEKKNYKQLTIEEKRKILDKFKKERDADFQNYKSDNYEKSHEESASNSNKSLNSQGIKNASEVTSYAYEKQGISPKLLKVYNGIGSFTTNLDKQAKFVFYDTQLKQNFVFIAQKDELIKQNNKIIEQNDEIIQLLKQIADK
ncbi:TPA: hypothetical protein ACN3DE_001576 [Staphylococcus aureus]|uniref:hypothetical protein n=1 Tax=Staphylococcus aureus TaxID=1280 RepID=UPI00193ADC3A|nr:hypothetical protein [Staphylococcus aureus]HDZ7843977.1 hypothetical protein [Staphylococcus aureus]